MTMLASTKSALNLHEAITCAEHAVNTGRRTPAERLAHFLLELLTVGGGRTRIAIEL
jgi:hypothetical protein